jgi:hypothetical protein
VEVAEDLGGSFINNLGWTGLYVPYTLCGGVGGLRRLTRFVADRQLIRFGRWDAILAMKEQTSIPYAEAMFRYHRAYALAAQGERSGQLTRPSCRS